MQLAKKLFLAPIFIAFLSLAYFFSGPFIQNSDRLFSFNIQALIPYAILTILFLLSSLSFAMFATFSNHWKLVLPVSIIAPFTAFAFLPIFQAIVLYLGTLVALIITYVFLDMKLKTYLSFSPAGLLSPSVKNLNKTLLLVLAILFFLNVNLRVQKNGFEIPDSLIDGTLQLLPQSQFEQLDSQTQQLNLDPEQIDILKQNPEAFKQYGLDPKILDTIPQPQNLPAKNLLKQTVKDQLNQVFAPYTTLIPIILAILFYLTLISISGILSLLVAPLLWVVFLVLKKTGFVQFEKEMREVKKIVI